MIILADYDQTYDEHPEIWGKVQAIVTGESWERAQDVMDDKAGPDVPIFFNPNPVDKLTLMTIVNHKAHIINTAHADVFYENSPQQVDMLTILCPDCKIVLVEEGKTAL